MTPTGTKCSQGNKNCDFFVFSIAIHQKMMYNNFVMLFATIIKENDDNV